MSEGDRWIKAVLEQLPHIPATLQANVLHGAGMRSSYAVDATPRMVLIDANGIVRAAHTGWGRETPGEVAVELRQWLP